MARYWIGVASRDHVQRGAAGGFCQLCHGKAQPLKRMKAGDWIAYYSGKERMDDDIPCRRFTAIGQVVGPQPYLVDMGGGFVPHRLDVRFEPAREVEILPLLEQLSFIPDKKRWGYPFRYGHLEVPQADFEVIARAMLGENADERLRQAPSPDGNGSSPLPAHPVAAQQQELFERRRMG